MKKNWIVIGVGLIFVAFCFLRFWNLHNRIIFDWDQEQFSNQIYDIVVNRKFTLLGPRVTDDLGFFLAPYFTYMLLPIYMVTRLDPNALIIFVVLINILFFWTSWFVIKKISSDKVALLFLFFWTFSGFFVKYDTIPWWPIMLPLGTVLQWFLLWKITKKNAWQWWMFLGISSGFFINMHFQFAFVLLFSVIFLVFWVFQAKQFSKNLLINCILACVAFLFMFLPLLLFDLRHEFLNTKLFLGFFTKSGVVKDFFVWQIVFANTMQQFTYVSNTTLAWGVYLLTATLSFMAYRQTKLFTKYWFGAFLVLWLLMPFAFMFYGKRPSEYYYIVFIPFMYVVASTFLQRMSKILILLFLIGFVFINFSEYQSIFKNNNAGLYAKKEMVNAVIEKSNNKKYAISFDGPPNTDTGFRYLIKTSAQNIYTDNDKYPLIQVRVPSLENDLKIYNYGIVFPIK